MTVAQDSPIDAAKAAFARRAWRDALDLYGRADRETTLSADDLAAYAEVAWWSGRPDDSTRLRERAYAAYIAAGDTERAALQAIAPRGEKAQPRAGTPPAAGVF